MLPNPISNEGWSVEIGAQGSARRSYDIPARVLAAWNRKILKTYSQRTAAALRATLSVHLALPRIESFLAKNVAKEMAKDDIVIGSVGARLAAGLTPDEEMSRRLLAFGKSIDSDFLARVADFPIGIVIRYEEIEPVRIQRINRLQDAVCRVLEVWHPARPAGAGRMAIRSSYSRVELELLIADLMRLYALETQALSRSLRLPALLVPLREILAQLLCGVMDEVAVRLAKEVADNVYRAAQSSRPESLVCN